MITKESTKINYWKKSIESDEHILSDVIEMSFKDSSLNFADFIDFVIVTKNVKN